jgi:hypothetical protein
MITLANQDLINGVTIARRNNFTLNGPNTAVVPALGSITVDGSRTIWAMAPTGTAPLMIFPGGGNWSPSPAQIAAQISTLGLMKDTTGVQIQNAVNSPAYNPITTTNAGLLALDTIRTAIPSNIAVTGVPLLRLNSPIGSQSGVALPITTVVTVGPFTMAQIGFYLYLSLTCNASATSPWAIVSLQWTDATTGFLMNEDTFVMPMAVGGQKFAIFGQVFSNQLTIQVNPQDTLVSSFDWQLIQTSQVHSVEPTILCEQLTKLATPGFPAPSSNMDAGLVMQTQIGVNASGNQSRLVPMYTGEVFSIVSEQGVGASNAVYKMTPAISLYAFNVANVVDGNNTIAGGIVPYQSRLKFPRIPMLTNYANNGSVVANFTHVIFSASSN